MKRTKQGVLLGGLLAMMLTACSSMDNGTMAENPSESSIGATTGSTASTSTGSSYGSGAATGSGAAASAGSSTASDAAAAGQATQASSTMRTPNSTVTSIEVLPRAVAGSTDTSTGASTAGSTVAGATVPGERVYRITVRMDDGSSQIVTQEWAPSFGTGERVRTVGGTIQR